MKNKMRKVAYAVSAGALILPALAFAQFSPPAGTGLQSGSITDIATNVMRWLLYLVGIIGVIGFVIAGILYLTAAGDEDRIDAAKRAMLYSIVGVIVALIGLVIIYAVQGMLSGNQTRY